jgi:hypothetical protein
MAHCCDARGNTDHCDSVKLPGYVSCVPKVGGGYAVPVACERAEYDASPVQGGGAF